MTYHPLPSTSDVRAKLRCLNESGLRELSAKSGRPLITLAKIKCGVTKSPTLETVAAIWPHIDTVLGVMAHHSREYRRECAGLPPLVKKKKGGA